MWQQLQQLNIFRLFVCHTNTSFDHRPISHLFLLTVLFTIFTFVALLLRSSRVAWSFRTEHYNQRRCWSSRGSWPTWIERSTRTSRPSRLTRYLGGSLFKTYLFENIPLICLLHVKSLSLPVIVSARNGVPVHHRSHFSS